MMTPSARRSFLAALCILPVLSVVAQADDKLKLKVRMSADPQAEDKRYPQNLFAVNDKAILLVRNSAETGIQAFDKVAPELALYDRAKLNVMRTYEMNLKVKQGQLFLQDVVQFNGAPTMITSRRDTINGKVELYWQKADPNLTKPHWPFEPLCSFDAKVLGTGKKMDPGTAYRDVFRTKMSPDGKFMLIHSAGVTGIDGRPRHLMVVVDGTMKVLWQRVVDMDFTDVFEQAQIDNAGNLYRVMRKPFRPKDVKKDTTTYLLDLQFINGDGIATCENGFEKERYLKTIAFAALPDGRIKVTGIHGGPNPKGEMTLTCFLGTLKTGEAVLEPTQSWLFEYDTDDAWMAKGVRTIGVLPRKDGGCFVLNEYFLQTDKSETKMALGGLRWVHGPIVVNSFDAKGNEQWTTTYRRLHIVYDRMVGDIYPMLYDDQLVMFLLDSDVLVDKRKANEKKQGHLDMKFPYSAYAYFLPDGTHRTKSILRSGGANDFIQGDRLYKITDKEYYLLGASKLGGNKLLPVKLEFGQ